MVTFKKYLYWSALGLLIYMPFHIFFSEWLSTYTGGLDSWKIGKDVFAAFLTFLCVITVLVYRKYTKLYLWILGLTAIYTLLHLLLVATTHQPFDTGLLATVYNTRLCWYVLIGYSLALLMPKQVNSRKIVRILILLSTIVCLIGLLQWVLPKDVMTHFGYAVERGVKPAFFIDDKTDLPRVFSTLRDPNSLGAFLILPITLLSFSLIKFWKTNRRTLLAGLLLLQGLVLFLTFSRGAWLGTIFALVTILALTQLSFNKNLLKRYLAVGVVGIMLLSGLVFVLKDQYVVQNVVFHSDESTKLADSNQLHASKLQKGLEGIVDKPLGHGPGTAGLVAIRSGGILTENYFVQVGYEVGLAGLAVFIAFLVLIIKNLWKQRKNYLPLALLASFVGLSVMNMLFHTWANEAVGISWFLIAGVMLMPLASGKKRA